jgi:NAD(P)-dependent dehydrogenase (short-subunit alcohol dehydrogenase family)
VTAPVVLISGGTGGLGSAMSAELAARGCRVYCAARTRPPLAADPPQSPGTGAEESGAGAPSVVELDVTSGSSIEGAVGAIVADAGRIDVLINNAGVHRLGAFEDMPEREWRQMLEVNFFGAVRLTRAVLPVMRAHRSGHVIMISSVGGVVARAADAFYCASKSALEAATEALRYEVARFGIAVQIVQPGAFRTAIADRGATGQHDLSGSPYELLVRHRTRKVRQACRNGEDPAVLAQLVAGLVMTRLSAASTPRGSGDLRVPAGAAAASIVRTLHSADQAERDAWIRERSQVDWWLRGEPEPEPGHE